MASYLNVCRFRAASAGTGSFVVSAAVTGYRTPDTAGAVNGATYRYRAENVDQTQWEIGHGTYTTATATLTRTVIANSDNSASAISFTSAPQVGVVLLKEDIDTFLVNANNLSDVSSAATARTNLGLAIGTNVQAWDADLDAVAALSSTGLAARTAANTWAQRTLQAPAAGLTITNPAGIAGDPTFALANDLAAYEGLSTSGLMTRTGDGTATTRTLTAPAAGITVSNGDGVSGNPTLALGDDLAALEGMGGAGLAARTATNSWTARTLTAPAAGFTVTNPAGVAGNPTFVLANDLAAVEGLASTGIVRRTGTDAWSAGTTVSNAELDTMAQSTIKGRAAGAGTGAATDLTATQATAILDTFTSGAKGLVPASGGGTTNFLRADGTFTAPAGGGDVTGPASSTDNAAARFDSTTGKIIQNSPLIIADMTGDLSRSGDGGIDIQGTNTNDDAPAGYVGEFGEVSLASGSAISHAVSGTMYQIVSLALPAGDWDVSAIAAFFTANPATRLLANISATSAAATSLSTKGHVTFSGTPAAGDPFSLEIPPTRFSLSATTTIYLNSGQVFSGGAPTGYGYMSARKPR